MNTDTKWEAVERGDLNPGDKVRLLHDNGDVIHTEVFEALGGKAVAIFDAGRSTDILAANGYRFERAVPERTLPTEPGVYRCPDVPLDNFGSIYTLNTGGRWSDDRARDLSEQSLPLNLVRLVPVTDVEEAEKRARTKALQDADALVQSKLAERGSLIGPYLIRNNFVEFHPDATEWEGRNV